MATFRDRLPTRHEGLLVFAVCAFLVYSWTTVVYFWEVPGWRKYLGTWELVVILAYALSSALIESSLVFLGVVLLRVLLPARVFRDRFAAKATSLVLMNALWAILLHLMILSDEILTWTRGRYALVALVYGVSVAFSWAFVHLSEIFAARIEALVDRMTVFVYLYVPLSILSLLIVTGRHVL